MHAQRTQSTAEEAILQLGLMSETALLKYIAGIYKTQFVSSERLAKAAIDRGLLKEGAPQACQAADRIPDFVRREDPDGFGRRCRHDG